jgi:hypothetical protein
MKIAKEPMKNVFIERPTGMYVCPNFKVKRVKMALIVVMEETFNFNAPPCCVVVTI